MCRSVFDEVEQAGRAASAIKPISRPKKSLREMFIEFSSDWMIRLGQLRGQREMAATDIGEMAYDEYHLHRDVLCSLSALK
jgi:hypothetical protein